MVQFFDRLTVDGSRRTADGYLVAEARVARTGIQVYTGREVDPDNTHGLRDRSTVKVYRPESEVFHADSLASYAHKPVTINHPADGVNAKNWRKHGVGAIGDDVIRDGEFVRVPLIIMDEAAIATVESGQRELSMGYMTVLKFDAGKTPDGEDYDVMQTQLRMNHVAVVPRARGGADLKLDEGIKPMTTRVITVDGLPVELSDMGASIVSRALDAAAKARADVEKLLADAHDAHAKAIAAKDTELAKKDAELADLRGKVLDASALDARVASRTALVTKARSLDPAFKTDGVSDSDVRKHIVGKVRGADAVAGKSEAYIEAAFDLLGDASSADPLRSALATRPATLGDAESAMNAAFDKSVVNMNSWRNKA